MQIHFSQFPEINELQHKILALGNFFAQDPDADDKTYTDAQQVFTTEPRDNGGE